MLSHTLSLGSLQHQEATLHNTVTTTTSARMAYGQGGYGGGGYGGGRGGGYSNGQSNGYDDYYGGARDYGARDNYSNG